MKSTTTLTFALICAPAALFAQQTSASASATAQASANIPASYSAEAKANIEASFKRAQQKNVPDQAMRQRLAEGEAKAASEAQVATAVQKTEARLEASQSAMVRAGRSNPTPEEINGGEQVMARRDGSQRRGAGETRPSGQVARRCIRRPVEARGAGEAGGSGAGCDHSQARRARERRCTRGSNRQCARGGRGGCARQQSGRGVCRG